MNEFKQFSMYTDTRPVIASNSSTCPYYWLLKTIPIKDSIRRSSNHTCVENAKNYER